MADIENAGTVTPTDETSETPAQEQPEPPERMYSEAELNALIQKESDRRVTQALARQRKEFDKKLSLATLDESKRADAEKDITIRELSEQVETFKRDKQKSDLKIALQGRGLPVVLADYIHIGADDDDGAAQMQYLDAITTAWNTAVQDEVKRRLVSGGVPRGGMNQPEKLTREQFSRMTLRQQAELYAKNPDLYKELTLN